MIRPSETSTGRPALVSSASEMLGGSKESFSRCSTGTSQSPRTTSYPTTIIYAFHLSTCSSMPPNLPLLSPRHPTIVALLIWQRTRYPHGVTATHRALLTHRCPPSPLPCTTSLIRGKQCHRTLILRDLVVLLWMLASRAPWIFSTRSPSLISGVHQHLW